MKRATVGRVPGHWSIPSRSPEDPVLLFLHGGGILSPWVTPMARPLSYLARLSGLRAFAVDYRIAPTDVFPAAHEDCASVYREFVSQGSRIILVGESSGGVLALATLLRAKAEKLPQPSLCVLISPVVDFGYHDPAIWRYEAIFPHPAWGVDLHSHYVAGADTSRPELSPVDADLAGLPPIHAIAGEHDFARGEIERLANAARRHSLTMESVILPDLWHGWNLLVPWLPEATSAYQALAGIIRQHTTPHLAAPG